MGRGRAKAKQQKVARDLKYNTRATDLDSLQRELAQVPPASVNGTAAAAATSEDRLGYGDPDLDDDGDRWVTGTG